MKRCTHCKMILYNDRELCPFCSTVLEDVTGEEEQKALKQFGGTAPYPNLVNRQRWMNFALKLILFIFVLCELALITINVLLTPRQPWAWISGISFLYLYLCIKYWVNHDSGLSSKIGLQIFLTMLIVPAIDYLTGASGWSCSWVLPGLVLLGDAMVLFLMFFFRDRWYTYFMLLILMFLCCVVLTILAVTGRIHQYILILISDLATVIFLLTIMIFFGKTFRREMERRFRI